MASVRTRPSILVAILVGTLSAAGCGGSEPPSVPPAPPEFQFNEAERKAAEDPKFAEFVKLCEARAGHAARLKELNRTKPKPRSEADQAAFERIQGEINEASTKIKQAMADPSWSDGDRKTLQFIFSSRGG